MNFREFKGKYQKVPVEHYPNRVFDNPMVSVCVQTYQHANYIEKCLEGILMQKTDFFYEILLGEDASTDSTREICIEYAEKYPNKIRLFLHKRENNIKVFGQATGRFNFLYNLYSARGKYVAICEGDDCWADQLKLKKQVSFLEINPTYSLVTGGYLKAYNGIKKRVVHREIVSQSKQEKDGFTFDLSDASKVWLTKTLTVLFRKDNFSIKNLLKYNYFRDIHLFYDLLKKGKGFYFQEIFGVYNIHHGGIHSLKDKELKYNSAYEIYNELYKSSPDIFTRTMKLRATLSLLGFKIRNEGVSSISKQRKLLKEIISLLRKPQDLIWILKEFVPMKIKNSIKDFFHI